jgi:hypothetical protein
LNAGPASPSPTSRLRPGALLVSGIINIGGALLVLLAMPGTASSDRVAAGWVLIQFITGVWAGVLGANTPLIHGLVVWLPALILGLVIHTILPTQFVAVTYAVVPAAALLAAAVMRFMRRRGP